MTEPLTAAAIVAQELARVLEPPRCDAREQEWRELWERYEFAPYVAWCAGQDGPT